MTRKEASDVLDDYDVNFAGHTAEEVAEAFDVAIEALKEEPCDDCIRREDALMALTGQCADSLIELLPKAIKRINALPPVTPQPKMGRWIYGEDGFECSECGCISRSRADFCQYCKTKMQEVEE